MVGFFFLIFILRPYSKIITAKLYITKQPILDADSHFFCSLSTPNYLSKFFIIKMGSKVKNIWLFIWIPGFVFFRVTTVNVPPFSYKDKTNKFAGSETRVNKESEFLPQIYIFATNGWWSLVFQTKNCVIVTPEGWDFRDDCTEIIQSVYVRICMISSLSARPPSLS